MKSTVSAFCVLSLCISITVATILHTSDADLVPTVCSLLYSCRNFKSVHINNSKGDTFSLKINHKKNSVTTESILESGNILFTETINNVTIRKQYNNTGLYKEEIINNSIDVKQFIHNIISVFKNNDLTKNSNHIKELISSMYECEMLPKDCIDIHQVDYCLFSISEYLRQMDAIIMTKHNKSITEITIQDWYSFLDSMLKIASQSMTKQYKDYLHSIVSTNKESSLRIRFNSNNKRRLEEITIYHNNKSVYTIQVEY